MDSQRLWFLGQLLVAHVPPVQFGFQDTLNEVLPFFIMRERGGKSLPFVCRSEEESVPAIRERVVTGTTIYADEASGWDGLHTEYDLRRINHSVSFVEEDACTNQAESYFSRLRWAEIGTNHHISGRYLHCYANDVAWCEDNRCQPNGDPYNLAVAAAMDHLVSRVSKGDWQRLTH